MQPTWTGENEGMQPTWTVLAVRGGEECTGLDVEEWCGIEPPAGEDCCEVLPPFTVRIEAIKFARFLSQLASNRPCAGVLLRVCRIISHSTGQFSNGSANTGMIGTLWLAANVNSDACLRREKVGRQQRDHHLCG